MSEGVVWHSTDTHGRHGSGRPASCRARPGHRRDRRLAFGAGTARAGRRPQADPGDPRDAEAGCRADADPAQPQAQVHGRGGGGGLHSHPRDSHRLGGRRHQPRRVRSRDRSC